MAETVLETSGLTMRFGGVTASDNVNFKLKARELRCLIGPNGAGKSTFFKCVTGLLTPTEGHVYMRGQEVTGWQPHQIASLGVGIKTQTPNVMDALSVHENIWLAARRFYNVVEARERADSIIDRLALGTIARTQLGQLAHGERQRVELGIVAVADPWLVLLDEPAAGMSAQDVDRMTEIIHELTRFAAVVIVEHDMQFIRSIAQTVTVFHQGAVLMEDNVERVMSDPQVRAVYLGKKA
ncbi:branched-chain amino acid transport system ATP-binding protein/urea transport system ATP-binding protein [Planktotalea frisia]|jgi:branched-chain amino acid transport system ATP-binding protein|uniref:Lipopolysaccharide export system ATP-binding protein LptB n=1 Tax=Planktotalea frisia TaxID=696762 RepID=A0A1L9NUV0_9RHOB|nr:ABC transporter ATP-binding protein [Planktotalea frisia]EDZ44433.1 ABC-type urea transport system, ATP-binding protein I [Rhodobacteraceae bacterium HTCC2083]OJI92934.1 lipopolysaccharide export system ATP-binding protein LptB [Planktotalea frisia]PZX25240.1 branched-chain amino acid transport system ATP-binding protein/urea transport system ATP-binding protein [Planktotalea frisia]HCW84701.1 ABC transporter ATP-binding protein [Paracoccaceae bacterium]